MAKQNLIKLQDELQAQVQREYSIWFEHIRNIIEEKRWALDRIYNNKNPDTVRIPLIKKNIELEKALFLTDDLDIEILTNWWVLWEQIMEKANMVLKYDYEDMDLKEMDEKIIDYNSIYWLAATIIDNRDDEEKQPMSDIINPLNLIIDPKNYTGSKLRFIWVRRRVTLDWLKNCNWFDKNQIQKIEWATDNELTQTERAINDSVWQRQIDDNDGMVDIYDHFTIHKWYKVLTTWWADNSVLLRYMIIEPLTKAEQLKPTKCKYPIQLHRRKPKFWSVFWLSIVEEVQVYQDIISQLTNLQIINTRLSSVWADMVLDKRLSIDPLSLNSKPGWRILTINNDYNIPLQSWIFYNQPPTPNQYTDVLINKIEQRAEESTSISKQQFWQTQQWQQTKAEVQTLQQNANNMLSWISDNYLKWKKEYWTCHYRSYADNFSKWVKVVSMFQKWKALSLELKKEDFIADWKVQIILKSKNQERIENDKEFNKLTFVSNLFLPNITSEYAKNELLRLMWSKSNVRDFDSTKYIRESVDEIRAKENLPLINRNIDIKYIYIPTFDDDIDVYIDIYKQAMETEAKQIIMPRLYEIKIQQKNFKPEDITQTQWKWNEAVNNIAMNNINNESL